MLTQQGAQQESEDEEYDNLAARIVKVHGNPLCDMGDIHSLPEGHVQWVEHEPISIGVREKCDSRGRKSENQFTELWPRPTGCLHPPPIAFHQTGSHNNSKDDEPQRPGTMGVDPKAKKRRQDP